MRNPANPAWQDPVVTPILGHVPERYAVRTVSELGAGEGPPGGYVDTTR